LFFENSTAALILVKRKSSVASLRTAAVVLGGLAPTSPHDDANKTGSAGWRGRNNQCFSNFFLFSIHFTLQSKVPRKKKKKKEREREGEERRKEKRNKDGRMGLTVRLLPVDSGTGVWGRGCEYDLAPGTMRVCRRRGRGRRGVVNGTQDRVDERV
jgi:hypothetical protein